MAYVNVAEWNPEHVVDWLRGLEDEIQPYTQFFVNNKTNGCQLLTLARDDLTNLNMTKIGHQELVLEAVEQLRQLHYNLTSETLQSLALKLGCKAQSLFNDLKRVCQDYANTGKKERVSVETLSGVSDIINLVKSLISWLDRYPFVGQDSYSDVRKTILKLSVELASTAQRDQFAENPHGIIKETCMKLAAQSDKVVQDFNDSLIIQPASLEVAKIKRKPNDDIGIHMNSSYGGIHIIESIKFQSPAYRSGKVEEGDEIVQVNYQTVVGWQIKNIICAMKEHPTEVHLTLKKRPRHPNVLGQVITLWPYRIPSKKTAFRKLYKWNKGKDIRELCPSSPGTRGEANSVSEVNGGLATEKEKLFAINKPRNRLRRRATVTGVSPTALQAPVSLEELIGSNSKRKDGVLRTISYDPNKTIDLEDNVFKREIQITGQDENPKDENQEPGEDAKGTKSAFLRPPQEKFMSGHLRRQEALKNSETVARAGVAVPMPQSTGANPVCPPPKPPLRNNTPPHIPISDANSVVQETPPSGSQSPKQKLAEWVNRQKKKPEGLLQHALTLFSPDSNSCTSPAAKESGSPKSPKCTNGSPKVKKTSGTMFQFPFREGRPSLSELRSLKRTANSKVFSERVNSNSSQEKPLTSPKPTCLQKRSQMQNKIQGLSANHISAPKISKIPPSVPPEISAPKNPMKITDSYIHPKSINYAKIPQYPCEMHESKIVSLKARSNSNCSTQFNKPNVQAVPPSRNTLHYQRARQMAKLASQGPSTLLKNQRAGYPSAFCSPSGRSLSFNNIAMSSDDDSSSEEYEIYEELSHVSAPADQRRPDGAPNEPTLFQGMDPHFTRQLAEMYNMLSQRQRFLQSQGNGTKGQMNAANSAVIDELALRMYHALQMNHMQSQDPYNQRNTNQQYPYKPPAKSVIQPPQRNNVPYQNGTYLPSKLQQGLPYQHQQVPQMPNQYVPDSSGKPANQPVHERPVDLPPSGNAPSRNINNVFKSATSQEIHNLYTSQMSNKSSVSSPPENEKSTSYSEEYLEKEHMYETIPYQKKDIQGSCDVFVGRVEEHSFVYPAEKEFEYDLPCKDGEHHLKGKVLSPSTLGSNSCFIKDNMFCPIKEEIPLRNANLENRSAFRQVVTNNNPASKMVDSNYEESRIGDMRRVFGKNVQPALSTLMKNIPKPPSESFPSYTKCSSSQTDSDFCDSVPNDGQSEEVSSTINCLNNDESFTTAHTSNSVTDSLGYSSSSSLSSSSSGSTISSSGSCYYYVDARQDAPVKFPPEVEDDTPLIDLRSPTLPTMGVSMLGKKRCASSSGSEQGSNAGSRGSPCVPVDAELLRTSRIVTDVEHTI